MSEYIEDDQIKCDKVIVILNTEGDKGEVLAKFEAGVECGKDFSEYFRS